MKFSEDTTKLVEKLRSNTHNNISKTNRALVPILRDNITFQFADDRYPYYIYDGAKIRNDQVSIVKTNIISYKRYNIIHKTDAIFQMSLEEAVKENKVFP